MRFLLIFILFNSLFFSTALADKEMTLFSSAKAAQARCTHDNVVWLNTNSGIKLSTFDSLNRFRNSRSTSLFSTRNYIFT